MLHLLALFALKLSKDFRDTIYENIFVQKKIVGSLCQHAILYNGQAVLVINYRSQSILRKIAETTKHILCMQASAS